LLRPDEVLSGILNTPILEVAHNALRILLQHHHMSAGCVALFGFGANRNVLSHLLLEIGIQALLWIELGAVAGQVEQLNLIFPFCYPRLHVNGDLKLTQISFDQRFKTDTPQIVTCAA
jgi:hypothetical protein